MAGVPRPGRGRPPGDRPDVHAAAPGAMLGGAERRRGDGGEGMKPPLTIDLVAPEGNVFAMVGKACSTLEQAGQRVQAKMLARVVPDRAATWRRQLRRRAANGRAVLRRDLAERATALADQRRGPADADLHASGLGPEAYPGTRTTFLITYDYTESGVTQRCGFICSARQRACSR